MFEIKFRDGLGRVGIWEINGKKVETPNLAVVINPNKMPVSIEWMKKNLNLQIIITNSYILRNSKYKEDIIKKGLHKFYNFEGVIYTDSGTFQMYSQGKAKISNEETISFQQQIGSDIITPLDLFTLPQDNYASASKKLNKTLERIKHLESLNLPYSFPIQGGLFLPLRRKATKYANKSNASVFAIGGIVPLMENYDFKNLVRIVSEVKQHALPSKPIHAFGAGHPIIFPLLVLLGIDLFDSASYALYAYEKRMICENKTYSLKDLNYFPCSCLQCKAKTPKEISIEELAKHNLLVLFKEIEALKAAIQEGMLYDYVEYRIGSRPELVKAYRYLLSRRKKMLLNYEPSTRRRGFITREEGFKRPMLCIAKNRVKFAKTRIKRNLWGIRVPLSLLLTYPFSQISTYKDEKEHYQETIAFMNKNPEQYVKDVLSYQFRNHMFQDLNYEKVKYNFSKTTSRLREVIYDDKVMLTLRSHDNTFVPTPMFIKFLKDQNADYPLKVYISHEAAPFVKKGKNVFAKFVEKCDSNIMPKDIVAIYVQKEFLGFGEALLTCNEMKEFKRGVAVKTK